MQMNHFCQIEEKNQILQASDRKGTSHLAWACRNLDVGFLGNPYPGRKKVQVLTVIGKDLCKVEHMHAVTPHRQ